MIKEKLFTALGAASMCWDPAPSDQVFDSVTASRIGEDCLKQIEEDIDTFTIEFSNWLRKVDTPENAEKWFGYTDRDMLNEFKEIKGYGRV